MQDDSDDETDDDDDLIDKNDRWLINDTSTIWQPDNLYCPTNWDMHKCKMGLTEICQNTNRWAVTHRQTDTHTDRNWQAHIQRLTSIQFIFFIIVSWLTSLVGHLASYLHTSCEVIIFFYILYTWKLYNGFITTLQRLTSSCPLGFHPLCSSNASIMVVTRPDTCPIMQQHSLRLMECLYYTYGSIRLMAITYQKNSTEALIYMKFENERVISDFSEGQLNANGLSCITSGSDVARL